MPRSLAARHFIAAQYASGAAGKAVFLKILTARMHEAHVSCIIKEISQILPIAIDCKYERSV